MIGGGSRCRQTLAGPPPPTTSITDPSSGEIDRSPKEQPVAGVRPSSGKDRNNRSCHSASPSSSAGEAGGKFAPTASDKRGGVIPRAVSDIFKFVREGLGTSAADCGGGRSVHLQGSKYVEEVDNRASTAASSGGTCTMDNGSGGCSTTSNNSGRSSYSEDFEIDDRRSATQWPWRKPNGPVHRQNEDPRAREHALPLSYSEGDVRALGNEGGRRHDRDNKRSAAQSMRGGSTVECSYMQVGADPRRSQHECIPQQEAQRWRGGGAGNAIVAKIVPWFAREQLTVLMPQLEGPKLCPSRSSTVLVHPIKLEDGSLTGDVLVYSPVGEIFQSSPTQTGGV